MGWHRPDPVAHWNDGYYFTRCLRCGEDLVRTAYSGWQVPKGYKVVWQGKPPPGKPSADLVPAEQEPAAAPAAASGPAAMRGRLRHLNAETLDHVPPRPTPARSDEVAAPPAAAHAASDLDHGPSPVAQPIAYASREVARNDDAGDLNGSATKTKAELPVMALIREIKDSKESGGGLPAERSEGESGISGGYQPGAEGSADEEAAAQAKTQSEAAGPIPFPEPDVIAQPQQPAEAEAAMGAEAGLQPTAEPEAEPELQAQPFVSAPPAEEEQPQAPEFEPRKELNSTEEQGELPGITSSDSAPPQPAVEMREADAPESEQRDPRQGELRELDAPEVEQPGQLQGEFHQADAPQNQQREDPRSSPADDEAAAEQRPEAAETVTSELAPGPHPDGTEVEEPAPNQSSLFDDFMEEDPNTDAWTDLASTPLPERPQPSPPPPEQAPPEPAPQLGQPAAAAGLVDPVDRHEETASAPEVEETRSAEPVPRIQQEGDRTAHLASPAPPPSEQPATVNESSMLPNVSNLAHGSDSPLEESGGDDVIEVYRGLKIAPGNAEQVSQADFMEETPSMAESAGGAKQARWWVAGPVAGSLAVLVLVAFFSGGRGPDPAIGSGASRSAMSAPAAGEAAPLPASRQADAESPLAQAAVEQPIPEVAEPAQQRETAFVAASFLQCRSAPVRQAPAVRKLARGDTIEVLTRIPEWASVSHRGRQCWVSDRFISPVEPL